MGCGARLCNGLDNPYDKSFGFCLLTAIITPFEKYKIILRNWSVREIIHRSKI
jgi:hypothetical protein